MQTRFKKPVIYVDGIGAIDTAFYRDDGVLVTTMNQHTLEDVRSRLDPRYKDAFVLELDDAIDRRENDFKTGVIEVTESQYDYALEVLPPQDWKTVDGVNSFFMLERTSGRVSCFYARYEGRYFSFSDVAPMKGEEIARRVKEFAHANLATA